MYFSYVAPSDRKVNIYEAIEKKKKKKRTHFSSRTHSGLYLQCLKRELKNYYKPYRILSNIQYEIIESKTLLPPPLFFPCNIPERDLLQ